MPFVDTRMASVRLLLRRSPEEAARDEDEAIVALGFRGLERLIEHTLDVFAESGLAPAKAGRLFRFRGFAVAGGVEQCVRGCGGKGGVVALGQREAPLGLLVVVSDEGS